MLQSLLSFILGALITWLITHYYYKKSTKIIDKLPEEIINKLKLDPRNKLSIKELNDLIDFKTRDFTKKGLDSYMACPKCGSRLIREKEFIDAGFVAESDGFGSYYPIFADSLKCNNCGWNINEFDFNKEHKDENIPKL